jgi:hypothetical protein
MSESDALEMKAREALALEWLNSNLAVAKEWAAKCRNEVEAFTRDREQIDPRGAFAETWRAKIGPADDRVALYQALLDIARDRDEWREQHENLVEVRSRDLDAVATRLSSPPPAVGGEVVERLSRVADWHESGGGYRREFEEGHLRIAADLRTVLAALTPQGGQKP